ncbi:hypothetical protein RvY_01348 [Ramazzottius varieornatus]|uniref:receptor protein-tyrosine kinase n=1 Tax=Ramazzottius varieornatus TaxID=947166 RepID=A0A1D1UGD5_RAMVA|nr:hypothetical protein RvY_01348 [Ramazzottius varieornatus]
MAPLPLSPSHAIPKDNMDILMPVSLSSADRLFYPDPTKLRITKLGVNSTDSSLFLTIAFPPVPGSNCLYKFALLDGSGDRIQPVVVALRIRDDGVGEVEQKKAELHLTGLQFKDRYELRGSTKCENRVPEEKDDVLLASLTTPGCLKASGFNLDLCYAPEPSNLTIKIEPSIYAPTSDSTLALTWEPPFATSQSAQPVKYSYQVYWNPIFENGVIPDELKRFGPKTVETTETFVTIPNIKCGRKYNVGVRAKGGKKGYGEAVDKRVDAPACFGSQSWTPTSTLASATDQPSLTTWQQLETPTNMILVGVCLLIGAFFLLLLGCWFKRRRARRNSRRHSSPTPLIAPCVKQGISWNDVYLPSATPARPQDLPVCSYEIQLYPPYAGSVKSSHLRYIDHIAQGAFGSVDHFEFVPDTTRPRIEVAIKTVKGVESEAEREALKKEIDVLKKLPPHLNVVALIGSANTEGVSGQDIFLVLEYCTRGDLKRLLLRYNVMANSTDPADRLAMASRSEEFLDFSAQIAAGMDHLAKHNIVHRDLAARNVLVTSDYKMKVTDFGLARHITSTYYRRLTQDAKLPWKWLAPEAFGQDNHYSTKSDVWSFGVLLHEIFSLGGSPYPSINHPRDLELYLQTGRRMEAPSNCPPDVYLLMLKCWTGDPEARPDFAALHSELKVLRRNEDTLYVPFVLQSSPYTTIYASNESIYSGKVSVNNA